MLIAQGSLYIDQQLQQGGVVAPAQLSPVNVVEINRCTLLALKRRAELMGPVCPHDQLTADLLATFQRHPGPRNHWSEAWVDAQLGMAMVGAGETGQALAMLKRSLTLGGEYDHPLTPITLLELGQLAAEAGDFTSASRYLEEASYSAVTYDDWTALEEAFRYGEVVHVMASRPGIFPPLTKAIQWAHTRDTELYASLLLSLAENNALIGQPAAAITALGEAKTAIARRDMGQHEVSAPIGLSHGAIALPKRNRAGRRRRDRRRPGHRTNRLALVVPDQAGRLLRGRPVRPAPGSAPRWTSSTICCAIRTGRIGLAGRWKQ